ncbi:TerB family tellurite resistance protein [Zhouia spongiae]|uniref:TerB family tellurite resistance protein n=1 Tax=Zhouia spongiae TaxID=2202721 RepID=A0ABY3YIZ1_9FLAO|nr:TerB family tellurite resistance protein [Zhouia spongiae]UNY97558.1 TerB family tellurite resistance protein [Zhouia spongiae]
MSNHSEKLSLLSDLVALIKADHQITDKEMGFLRMIAARLDVNDNDLNKLFNSDVPFTPPSSEAQRILQFHRMVLLMNVDQDEHPDELNKIRELGVRLGLNPFAINQVLKVMDQFDGKVVPPDVLINIFKTQYN